MCVYSFSSIACALRHRCGDLAVYRQEGWKAISKASLGGGAAKILREQAQRWYKASLDGGAAKILKEQTERPIISMIFFELDGIVHITRMHMSY